MISILYLAPRWNLYMCIVVECISPLGMADRTIKDSQITTSSFVRTAYGWQARLHQNIPDWGAWCANVSGGSSIERNYDQYIQIDLLKLTKITGIATQGRKHNRGTEYVKDYKISYSKNSLNWIFYEGNDQVSNEAKVGGYFFNLMHLKRLASLIWPMQNFDLWNSLGPCAAGPS